MSVYKEPMTWLCQAIDSILCQTFSDFEFIIVCDNPYYEDGIMKLREYAEKDSRIRLMFNDENIGLTKSLNKALKIATGEYIARMDADDISFSERLEKQYSYLEANKNVIAVGTYAELIDENNQKTGVIKQPCDPKRIRDLTLWQSCLIHPSVLIRNFKGLCYNEDYRCSQDYELWTRLVKLGDLSNIDEILLKYRQSNNQISSAKSEEQDRCGLQATMAFAKSIDFEVSESDIKIVQELAAGKYEVKVVDFKNLILKIHEFNKHNKFINTSASLESLIGLFSRLLIQKGETLSIFPQLFFLCLKIKVNPAPHCYLALKLLLSRL